MGCNPERWNCALVFGVTITPQQDWLAIILLTVLAAAAEHAQMNVYGENTVSVSVSLAFAAALIGGVPGAMFVSAAIALTHFIVVRPVFYKSIFNWATHLLAEATPALAIIILREFGMDTPVASGRSLGACDPVCSRRLLTSSSTRAS